MRFISPRDYNMILKFNRELTNEVVETPVVLYKLHVAESKTNSYGESVRKVWYSGVQIPCLIDRQQQNPMEDMQTINFEQAVTFAFLREELKIREIYPETGDIIDFDSQYYEINNVNENQLIGGRVEYNHSIVCECHLTRKTNLQLEKPLL